MSATAGGKGPEIRPPPNDYYSQAALQPVSAAGAARLFPEEMLFLKDGTLLVSYYFESLLLALDVRSSPGTSAPLGPSSQSPSRLSICAVCTLKSHASIPGHSIAAARALKSSLSPQTGGEGA